MPIDSMQLADWRNKARSGELTLDEMKTALAALRAQRTVAGAVSAKSTSTRATAKAKAAAIDTDDLLKDLMS